MKKDVDATLLTHANPDDVIQFYILNLSSKAKVKFYFLICFFVWIIVQNGALGTFTYQIMLNVVDVGVTVGKYHFAVKSSKSKLLINFWWIIFHWFYIYDWALTLSLMVSKGLSIFSLTSPFLCVGYILKDLQFFFNCGTRGTYQSFIITSFGTWCFHRWRLKTSLGFSKNITRLGE